MEVSEEGLERRDISLFEEAYDAIHDRQDLDAALASARRYFAGAQSDAPAWEYLCGGEATAVKDISHRLWEQK